MRSKQCCTLTALKRMQNGPLKVWRAIAPARAPGLVHIFAGINIRLYHGTKRRSTKAARNSLQHVSPGIMEVPSTNECYRPELISCVNNSRVHSRTKSITLHIQGEKWKTRFILGWMIQAPTISELSTYHHKWNKIFAVFLRRRTDIVQL